MTIDFQNYPFAPKVHAPRLPPLADGMDVVRHGIVIVGGGPVGLALALGLANHGVAALVLEADDGVCSGSRAICVSRRSLEIVERLGALPAFLAKGLPWTGGRSFWRDTEVLRFAMPHDENQKLPPMLNLEQFYIERFLVDACEARPELVEIRWATRVTGFRREAAGAVLDLSTALGDYRLAADWVVACDGGRSVVREALGLPLLGTSYEGRYVIADIALKSDLPTERLAWFDPPSNPGSSLLMHRQPDDVWRIDYQIGPDEDAEAAIRPENVVPRVQSHLDMIGETGAWAPIWITLYKAHALSLERYTHGRVLFAGDAAHLVPIFGVRGLNSGIDDADNLAWKLALRVKGLAGDTLLDSYSDERTFATRENLRHGTKSTEFMAPPTFAFAWMREAVLSLAERHETVRPLINPRQTATITYVGSPLNQGDDDSAGFAAGPAPGAVLAESPLALLRDGEARDGFLTDLIGPRFTALCFSEDGAVPAGLRALEAELASAGIPFAVVPLSRRRPVIASWNGGYDAHGTLFALQGAAPGTCCLLRPDGHVLARWKTTDAAAIRAVIARVLGLSRKVHDAAA